MKNKRSFTFLWITFFALYINAQDFVSLFLENHENDSTISCITISPTMMEEILKTESDKNDTIVDVISKLKSMKILTTTGNGEAYYDKALETFEKSSRRYEHLGVFNSEREDYKIFVRKRRKTIVEMTMLLFRNDQFAIINFTGNIEPGFILTLAKSVSQTNEVRSNNRHQERSERSTGHP